MAVRLFYILELVTVSVEFCLIVTSIQEGVAFFHFFFSIDFFNETPFREFFNSVEQNLCQAHQNSTLDDSVPRCPRNVRKSFSVPYISTFILASASCVRVSAHASEKKIIYQVCLEEISPSSTMSQLFEVNRPRGTIDLNKRWTFFVAWCKCASAQRENSWSQSVVLKPFYRRFFTRAHI